MPVLEQVKPTVTLEVYHSFEPSGPALTAAVTVTICKLVLTTQLDESGKPVPPTPVAFT